MIAAVVPAAGRSERMGRPKLALTVDGRPMLERVIAALRDGGASPIVVVTGPHDPALAPLARAAGAEVCELLTATPDMRTTVEHGLRWLEEHYHPQPDDAFLLTPGDIPFLDAAAIEQLCETWRSRPPATILIPRYGTRRGHPALIGWQHVKAIRGLRPGVGIDSYLRESADATIEVAAPGKCISVDMNSPTDFASLTDT
jgi:molybdenum cofactor cytidylyltransferase